MIRSICTTILMAAVILGIPAASPPALGAAAAMQHTARELAELTSYTASVVLYEEAAALLPLDPDPLVSVGNIYLLQSNWPMAADAFNRALARQTNHPAALKGLGAALWGQGDHVRAINAWEVASTVDPDDYEIAMRLGRAYIYQGDLTQGESILQAALQQVENMARANDYRAETAACIKLEIAIAQAPRDLLTAIERLRTIPSKVAVAEQSDYLVESLTFASQSAKTSDQMRLAGIALSQVHAWAPAAEALQRAISLRPEDAEALAFLGYVQSQRGQPALEYLAAATEADSFSWTARFFLGQHLSKVGHPAAGIVELEKCLALVPDNPAVYVALSEAHVAIGDYAAAEEALRQAVSLAPRDVELNKRLVAFYADTSLKAAEAGLTAAVAASELDPQDSQLQDNLGWIYFLTGDTHRAFLHLYTAWQLSPDQASTYYHLGRLYQVNGQADMAADAFRRATELDNTGEYRARAQQALREQTQ
jgi:tetratricopeptide (TPR) repeat protein